MKLERISRRAVLGATAGIIGTGVSAGSGPKHGRKRNHLIIVGGRADDVVEYQFGVSGRVQKSRRSGDAPIPDHGITADRGDMISDDQSYVTGTIAGGVDAYRFTGRITRFRISLTRRTVQRVKIFLNGRRVLPDELGDNPAAETPIEFLDCNTARVIGDFQGIELNASFWDEAGIATSILFPDPISGVTTLHPVEQFEPYPFTIESLRLDPNPIQIPGDPALYSADNPYAGPWCEREAFQFPNQLVITGGSSEDVVKYEFGVSGSVKKSADADGLPLNDCKATIDEDDRITGTRVSGSVSGEVDVYRFSGEITDFRVDGNATIFLNGQRVRPRDLGTPPTDRKRAIEYLDCDRAVVRGRFQQIWIDTVWFDQSGFATSFNIIGPVRGRTIIDRSNAGDIGDISGFVITRLTAFDEEFGEPVITAPNPNLEECFQQITPEPVRPFFVDCGPTNGGRNVVFGYDNPNDVELLVPSEFVGNATSDPPQVLEPGRNTFTVGWQPTTSEERLTWRLNLEPFAIDAQPTATSPTAADCSK